MNPAPTVASTRCASPTLRGPSLLPIALEAAAPRDVKTPPTPPPVVVAVPVAVPVAAVVVAPERVAGGNAVLACDDCDIEILVSPGLKKKKKKKKET